MSYTKRYIGKGTLNEELGIVRFSMNEQNLELAKHEWQGETYYTFETGRLREPDRFGRTHTAWVSKRDRIEETPLKDKKGPGRPKGSKNKPKISEPEKEKLPF